jgi:uncharacterized protein (UPF0147 family)
MELIDALMLANRREGAINAAEALDIAQQIADGPDLPAHPPVDDLCRP